MVWLCTNSLDGICGCPKWAINDEISPQVLRGVGVLVDKLGDDDQPAIYELQLPLLRSRKLRSFEKTIAALPADTKVVRNEDGSCLSWHNASFCRRNDVEPSGGLEQLMKGQEWDRQDYYKQ